MLAAVLVAAEGWLDGVLNEMTQLVEATAATDLLPSALCSNDCPTALNGVCEDGGSLPPVSGKIKVKLSDSLETEVEASAYMAELRNEVSQLRAELASQKAGALAEAGGGLLAFMQGLGRENVQSLTSSISDDVLEAMRVLIENILSEAGVAGESFMETSGLKLRELLVWQLITGYKLRELEAREELNQKLYDDDSGEAEGDADS